MSTSVVLRVRLPFEADQDSDVQVPTDIAALLTEAGQATRHGWYKSGDGPWRLHFQLAGPDRVEAGRALAENLRQMGYEAEVSITR